MLELDVTPFQNVTECDEIGPQTIEARVSGRVFRITAARNLRVPVGEYWALYEERLPIETIGKDYTVWVRATEFPWAAGQTVEQCLRGALHWVNDAPPLESVSSEG